MVNWRTIERELKEVKEIAERHSENEAIVLLCAQLKKLLKKTLNAKPMELSAFVTLFGREPKTRCEKVLNILIRENLRGKKVGEWEILDELHSSMSQESLRQAVEKADALLLKKTHGNFTIKYNSKYLRNGPRIEIENTFSIIRTII